MDADVTLRQLGKLVGVWSLEATHPQLPGVVVRGSAEIEWLEGERFLIQRARMEHPDFPDSIAVIGFMNRDRAAGASEDALRMHYFDSRGVSRLFDAAIDGNAWRLWRDAPGFSQRFRGEIDGDAIHGLWQLSKDDVTWSDDLRITYRRVERNDDVRHLSVTLERPASAVYEVASDPRNLPKWARGLAGTIENVHGEWLATSPMGRVKVRFVERNALGVLDHDVTLPSGEVVHNVMRVVPRGDQRSEITFTIFRRPGVTDAEVAADASAVTRDLRALKELLE